MVLWQAMGSEIREGALMSNGALAGVHVSMLLSQFNHLEYERTNPQPLCWVHTDWYTALKCVVLSVASIMT